MVEVTPFQTFRGDSKELRVCLLRSGRLVFCERFARIVGADMSGNTQQSNSDLRRREDLSRRSSQRLRRILV